MSLYDKASLIQVPSLYKDGTLVSTIPEDRSGDFTVVRGSNLSATRIGPDGYIKKGYENLLLQSNSFDTWVKKRVFVTSGQSGYDGSSDAWLLENNLETGQAYLRKPQNLSGVKTFSIYAKHGTASHLRLNEISTGASVFFDLINGVISEEEDNVSSYIESIGNDWYRCSSVISSSSTGEFRVQISQGGSGSTSIGDNIYIQDAQLNQGLVAYPYLETTTAPAQGGLLENTPRLDWSNGVPALLLEPSRTNVLPYSEYFQTWFTSATLTSNYGISPEGVRNSTRVNYSGVNQYLAIGFQGVAGTGSIYVKGVSGETITIGAGNAAGGSLHTLNGDWQRVSFYDDGTSAYFTINTYFGTARDIEVFGAQVEQNATYETSYIPTYGTSQTRSNEVISDDFNIPTTATIYNSFYSDVAETVFVFDQVFNVVEGLNKVAIAFSPTAVKISVGGSIVANATGTYDTTSLTNIQLGSNNGTDYSNAPISGFYTFPEFLTDEELNSLTD